MKKYVFHIAVSLFLCLFIYVFYRTEKTLVNQLMLTFLSQADFHIARTNIQSLIPLPESIIYSLPEGLWVFCITLTSGSFYLEIRQQKWRLALLPIILVIMMELFQLFHIANGRFDIMDILFSTGFWLVALFLTNGDALKEPLFQPVNSKTLSCFLSYGIVYLAHVSY